MRRRPRVLLVDDHQAVLETVSSVLADAFDVAGTATDGTQALEVARRVDPDLIVLDVTMPGLDGFQTLRMLDQNGSRARAVFLSMHDSDDHVAEAFRCGGRGYVLKSRLGRDLPSALDHVLNGRTFVPSLTSLFHVANGVGGHAMQLHGDEESFLDGAAAFFDMALRRGDATCVLATDWFRDGLARRLHARGWDVGSHRRYVAVDAADALSRFMRDGRPDPSRLAEIAAELDQYRLGVGEGAAPRLTIFGNMVGVLRMQGNDEAVIAVERLWHTLTHGLPFITLCGYSTACFGETSDLLADACAAHWAVSHSRDL
jgi:CheY-like chemotaxis protein